VNNRTEIAVACRVRGNRADLLRRRRFIRGEAEDAKFAEEGESSKTRLSGQEYGAIRTTPEATEPDDAAGGNLGRIVGAERVRIQGDLKIGRIKR